MAPIRFGLPVLVLTLGLSQPLAAQILGGRIIGSVVDDAGRPVRGAIIVADNPQATPPTRAAVANDEGRFGIMSLKTGVWVMLVRASGYEPVTRAESVQSQRPGPPISITLVRIPGSTRTRTFDDLRAAAVMSDLDKAARLVDERQFDEGIAIYRQVIARAPALTSVQLALARAYRAKPDLARARTVIDALLAVEPDNLRARLELALILEAAGDRAAETAELERILREAPESQAAAAAREKLTASGRSPSRF